MVTKSDVSEAEQILNEIQLNIPALTVLSKSYLYSTNLGLKAEPDYAIENYKVEIILSEDETPYAGKMKLTLERLED